LGVSRIKYYKYRKNLL